MMNQGTGCCIVGGGPAGMMLGFLLARAGVEVVVLEKHGDFFRDFRGDTIHPSTLELMHELGVLDDFLRQPHQKAETVAGRYGGFTFTLADLRHLPTHCRFIALMPQWDFLDFIARQARAYPHFQLLMNAEAERPIEEGGRVAGVRVVTPDGIRDIRARLVVACDGRHSVMRKASALPVDELGAPMDVLWFSLPRHADDPTDVMGVFEAGRLFVMIYRGDYWQCAFVIAKGSLDELKSRGIEAFRSEIATIEPRVADRVSTIAGWDDVHLLTVAVNRLRRWHKPGLLCIGDAAHAMSPVGGVGINLAVQDAVAAANILADVLYEKGDADALLPQVQARREWPTRVTQRLQVLVQDRLIRGVLTSQGRLKPPLLLRLAARLPWLQRIPAYLVGVGVRPEHIRTPLRRTP